MFSKPVVAKFSRCAGSNPIDRYCYGRTRRPKANNELGEGIALAEATGIVDALVVAGPEMMDAAKQVYREGRVGLAGAVRKPFVVHCCACGPPPH